MAKYVIYGKHQVETIQKQDRVISHPLEYPNRAIPVAPSASGPAASIRIAEKTIPSKLQIAHR
jgi:hypothetical protein